MAILCKCPHSAKNLQQELINKHSLLADEMMNCLLDLMSHRTEPEPPQLSDNADSAQAGAFSTESNKDRTTDGVSNNTQQNIQQQQHHATQQHSNNATRPIPPVPVSSVIANPSPTSHIPSIPKETYSSPPQPAASTLSSKGKESVSTDLVNFTPNSLVVISAAALLESILSSNRETSSPELLNKLLDSLYDRCDVLIQMLKSNSFLIMENAAILMFTLIKNRPQSAMVLKELALSEMLVLRHFYNAVFSPSNTQRFISRFLVATWITGSEKVNPGKALLYRIVPSGIVEFLKFGAVSEEHRANLDNIEEEFYSGFLHVKAPSSQTKNASTVMQSRMRKRISTALKDSLI